MSSLETLEADRLVLQDIEDYVNAHGKRPRRGTRLGNMAYNIGRRVRSGDQAALVERLEEILQGTRRVRKRSAPTDVGEKGGAGAIEAVLADSALVPAAETAVSAGGSSLDAGGGPSDSQALDAEIDSLRPVLAQSVGGRSLGPRDEKLQGPSEEESRWQYRVFSREQQVSAREDELFEWEAELDAREATLKKDRAIVDAVHHRQAMRERELILLANALERKRLQYGGPGRPLSM